MLNKYISIKKIHVSIQYHESFTYRSDFVYFDNGYLKKCILRRNFGGLSKLSVTEYDNQGKLLKDVTTVEEPENFIYNNICMY